MKLILKTIIVFCAVATISFGGVLVKADATNTVQSSEYLFHLYLNVSNQLVIDRTFKFNYEIISSQFVQSATGQFPYRGEVINFTGEVTSNFKFDVQSGTLSIHAPYVADGQKVIFYDNQNQPILTIPVSDSSFCNDDGICNADRGEDSLSCPKDCKQALPAPPTTSPTPTSGGSNGLLSSILYILAGLVIAGLVWWYYKRRGKSNNMTLPPTPPSAPLPTPVAPITPNNPV